MTESAHHTETFRMPEDIPELTFESVQVTSRRVVERMQDVLQTEHVNKPFHNERHSQMVAQYIQEILTIMLETGGFSSEQRAFYLEAGAAVGYAHDSVIDVAVGTDDGFLKRRRGWKTEYEGGSGNEYKSFQKYVHFFWQEHMEDQSLSPQAAWALHEHHVSDTESSYALFMRLVEDGIRATYPDFDFNAPYEESLLTIEGSEGEVIDLRPFLNEITDGTGEVSAYGGLKVMQKYSNETETGEQVTIMAPAAAMADTFAFGLNPESESPYKAGMGEMLETNVALTTILGASPETVSVQEVEIAKGLIRDGLRTQVQFALHQKGRVGGLVASPSVPPASRDALGERIRYFDQSLSLLVAQSKAFEEDVVDIPKPDPDNSGEKRPLELRILRKYFMREYKTIADYRTELDRVELQRPAE